MADKEYPVGALPLMATSGNVAAASAVATIAADAARYNYITKLEITYAGATAAAIVVATITGLLNATPSYIIAAPVGALVGGTPLVIAFSPPIRTAAINTAIVATLPSLGAGNTNACVNIYGYSYPIG